MITNVITFKQLEDICSSNDKQVYEIAQEIMAAESGITIDNVRAFVNESLIAMKEAIISGLSANEQSLSTMCGNDCAKLQKKFNMTHSILGPLHEKLLKYSIAVSEENIRMGKIVACPTAGSCGILPSVIVALAEEYGLSDSVQLNALITAGEIGRIIALKMPLAGAVAGCQAECGVASSMAAAAACQMLGGNITQILNAGALALKNVLGLTCDPVAGLVEVPCVKRNAFLAVHALTACELALSDVKSVIPFDEVVDAAAQTGALMSPMLKESSDAGLATTKTALDIKAAVFGN